MAAPAANLADTSVAEFVGRFADTWSAPTPERLAALLHADVRLVQPLLPRVRGRGEAGESFRRLLALIPDLSGDVLGWHGGGDTLFIELRLTGTLGGRPLAWDLVDRITLEDGLVLERISYFDGVRLAAAIATRPRAWPAALRAGLFRRPTERTS